MAMRRVVMLCQRVFDTTHFARRGNCRCIHFTRGCDIPEGGCLEKRSVSAPSKIRSSVTLNPLSTAVRRFLEHSSNSWETTPGGIDTLLTILLKRQCDTEEGLGTLHPLLGVEILKRLGYAVWTGGWARRSGLSAEDMRKLAKCVLQPLIPHALSHPKVRPLLPILVEWLVCISDIPLLLWLPQLSFCVDNFVGLDVGSVCSAYPSPEFFLQHIASKLRLLEVVVPSREVPQDMHQVLDKLFQLLVRRQNHTLAAEGISGDVFCSVAASANLADCLFWQGEAPLLLHSNIIRETYSRLCLFQGSTGGDLVVKSVCARKDFQPTLQLLVVDDDVFRRLLLRLLASPSRLTTTKAVEVSLDSAVLVELLLQLEDPSVILRFIMPLSDFVSVNIEGGNSSSLQLSFNSISMVIHNAIEELQQLPKRAALPRYSLLPQKARIHALKSLCERLLKDAEEKLYSKSLPATFSGMPLLKQVYILQSFCHAARCIVRAVMAEKTASLLEEGPEGSALQAGMVPVAKHRDVTTVLCNTAFRILEPSLLRYYDTLNEWTKVSSDDDENMFVVEAVNDVENHAGGRATLLTARHLLQHPLRHDVTAIVEALRLVAIQALVLRSPQCEEWLQENYSTTLADAFFSVWHRTMKSITSSHGVLGEVEQLMSRRLLWTMLLLHQSCCPCCASLVRESGVGVGSDFICAVLRSLLDLLTLHGTRTEFASFGWPPPSEDTADLSESGTVVVEEGKKHCGLSELWTRRILYPPTVAGVVVASTTRWELQEELLFLGGGGDCVKWRWLGSVSAVREAALAVRTAANSSAACVKRGADPTGYLLPWTTVALSRHPLRLYDESGQSAAAASAFDADVELLLQHITGPMLRLVGVAEEALVFRDLAYTPELSLGSSLIVIHPEARLLRRQRRVVGAEKVDDDADDDNLD